MNITDWKPIVIQLLLVVGMALIYLRVGMMENQMLIWLDDAERERQEVIRCEVGTPEENKKCFKDLIK